MSVWWLWACLHVSVNPFRLVLGGQGASHAGKSWLMAQGEQLRSTTVTKMKKERRGDKPGENKEKIKSRREAEMLIVLGVHTAIGVWSVGHWFDSISIDDQIHA